MEKILQIIVSVALIISMVGIVVSFQKLNNLESELEGLKINGNEDIIAGGITRVAIGAQTKWTTDLIPSSSFTVNLGSSALPVNNYFGTNASFSSDLELTAAGSNFGINPGAVINTMFEVGGSASISGSVFLIGAIDAGGAVSFEIPSGAGGTTVDATGEMTFDTSSISLNLFDGTAERVIAKNEKCFSFNASGTNVDAKNQRTLKRFRDPFTITYIASVASGTNSASWNLHHGAPGTVTTKLFTADKQASTSTYPEYTTFNDATIEDRNVLDWVITSQSATIDSIGVTVCGRYDP